MKTALIVCSLFFLFLVSGCSKKEPLYEIVVNHSIPACGITDPIRNIPWLKAYCSEHSTAYSVTISVYKSNTSEVNHIVIETSTVYIPGMSPSPIYTTSVYSCEGERLLFQGTEGSKPAGYDAFFLENTRVAKIWEVKMNI